MVPEGLPKQVCVLDLETEKLVAGDLGKMPLAFVGTMTYELRDGRYCPSPHQLFLPDELEGLESLLRDLEGLMLGHNILNFDYEVLKPRMSFQGMAEKTVDTLGFLYEKRITEPLWSPMSSDSLEGLSLDNLAQKNLGRGKVISGRSIPKMWREGRKEEVIAYNKEDLILTFSLWHYMVEGQMVVIREQDEADHYQRATEGDRVYEPWRVEIFPEDVPRLTGQAPLYNTREVRITGGPPLDEPPPEATFGEPSRWYLDAFARHYLREDELMISDPRMGFSGGYFEAGPYPANWFTLRVEHEGPRFPLRPLTKKDLEDMGLGDLDPKDLLDLAD